MIKHLPTILKYSISPNLILSKTPLVHCIVHLVGGIKQGFDVSINLPCCPGYVTLRNAVTINLLKSTGHVMHQQFNIQQLYALPTLFLCVLYLSENKQPLVPLTA